MDIWKRLIGKFGPPIGFALMLTACAGAGRSGLLPTPDPTAVPRDEVGEEGDPGSTETPASDQQEEDALAPTRIPAEKYADLEIITLLPRDAIPAIDDPQFLTAAEGDDFYDPNELVIGVDFDGDARAYSVPYLSNHEIVNDTVGGVKIAVTW